MKCVICNQRKGKRFCPAKNAHICAQCCGEKRVVEIACPVDCQYLKTGQEFQSIKKYIAMVSQEENPTRRQKFFSAMSRWGSLLSTIEKCVVEFGSTLSTLRDRDVLAAVKLVKKTYETERKGLIFEHSSSDPIAQSLSRDLRERLEEARKAETGSDATAVPGIDDLIESLEAVQMNIEYHLRSEQGEAAYLRFTARNHPEAAARPGGGLIIP